MALEFFHNPSAGAGWWVYLSGEYLTVDGKWVTSGQQGKIYHPTEDAVRTAFREWQNKDRPKSSEKESLPMTTFYTAAHKSIFRKAIIEGEVTEQHRLEILRLLEEKNAIPELAKETFRKLVVGLELSDNDKNTLLDLLEKLAAGKNLMLTHKISAYEVTEPVYRTVLNFCRDQKRIDAIKAFRTATNLGLKEAKDAIDIQFPHNRVY